jgi:hypothetical protein
LTAEDALRYSDFLFVGAGGDAVPLVDQRREQSSQKK